MENQYLTESQWEANAHKKEEEKIEQLRELIFNNGLRGYFKNELTMLFFGKTKSKIVNSKNLINLLIQSGLAEDCNKAEKVLSGIEGKEMKYQEYPSWDSAYLKIERARNQFEHEAYKITCLRKV